MAIELISKIKPKNNGSFPLVDAHDVLVSTDENGTEKRLPEALEELKTPEEIDASKVKTSETTTLDETLKNLTLGGVAVDGDTIVMDEDGVLHATKQEIGIAEKRVEGMINSQTPYAEEVSYAYISTGKAGTFEISQEDVADSVRCEYYLSLESDVEIWHPIEAFPFIVTLKENEELHIRMKGTVDEDSSQCAFYYKEIIETGTVGIGKNIAIDNDGVISVPNATSTTAGVVSPASSYFEMAGGKLILLTASKTVKGGVRVNGNGLYMNGDLLCANRYHHYARINCNDGTYKGSAIVHFYKTFDTVFNDSVNDFLDWLSTSNENALYIAIGWIRKNDSDKVSGTVCNLNVYDGDIFLNGYNEYGDPVNIQLNKDTVTSLGHSAFLEIY